MKLKRRVLVIKPLIFSLLTVLLIILLLSGDCTSSNYTSSPDSDGDGWSNAQEASAGTDPYSKDTDSDGYWDPQDPNPTDSSIPTEVLPESEHAATPEPTIEPQPEPPTEPQPEPGAAIKMIAVIGLDHSSGSVQHGEFTVAVNTITNKIYVNKPDTGYRGTGSSIKVIDGENNTLVSSISPPWDYSSSLALDEKVNKLYVSLFTYVGGGYAGLGRIDLTTHSLNWEFKTERKGGNKFEFLDISFNPVTGRVYQCIDGEGLIIASEGQDILAKIGVGSRPRSVAIDTLTNTILVANRFNNTVSILDGVRNSVIATISVGSEPFQVCVNESRSIAYVSCNDERSVHVIDIASRSVVDMITLDSAPHSVVFNPTTNHLFVSLPSKDCVEIYDTVSLKLIASVPVGDNPTHMAVNSKTSCVYVVNRGTDEADRSVSVIQDSE